MKRFTAGLICGVIIGAVVGVVLWLMSLPAPPSAYRPKFPITTEPLPAKATHEFNASTLGFDIYRGPKPNRLLKKTEAIPLKKSTSWLASSGQDGSLHVYETFWAEYDGKLYQLAHFTNRYHTTPNRNMSMLKVIDIKADRTFTVQLIIPDMDLDETFGPFELPTKREAEPSAAAYGVNAAAEP